MVGRCFSAHYAGLRCVSRNVRVDLRRVFCRTSSIRLPCFYYFFLAVVVIRYETTATARWALLFIVRAFFNDTITVAVWTGFHVGASWDQRSDAAEAVLRVRAAYYRHFIEVEGVLTWLSFLNIA